MGTESFVNALRRLHDQQDRGALAALRTGLKGKPGEAYAAYPFVVPHLPERAGPAEQRAYCLVAALFASYPHPGLTDGRSDFGATMARLKAATGSDSVEKRFVALLDAHPEDLHHHLRHAVSLCRAKEIPINWLRLLEDLLYWSHPDTPVQRRWALRFWEAAREPNSKEE